MAVGPMNNTAFQDYYHGNGQLLAGTMPSLMDIKFEIKCES